MDMLKWTARALLCASCLTLPALASADMPPEGPKKGGCAVDSRGAGGAALAVTALLLGVTLRRRRAATLTPPRTGS